MFQAEVNALRRLQAETTADLDALFPVLLARPFGSKLVPLKTPLTNRARDC